MRLPRVDDIPAEVSLADAARVLEAMMAGLWTCPPDSFMEDWEESVEEGERLLDEIRGEMEVAG